MSGLHKFIGNVMGVTLASSALALALAKALALDRVFPHLNNISMIPPAGTNSLSEVYCHIGSHRSCYTICLVGWLVNNW